MNNNKINDPWHSRPLDVHRWSDHPEVKALTAKIWSDYLPSTLEGKSGPKPKMEFKKQLRALILDLYVAWVEDPELCLGIQMSPNEWDANSRYNALYLSKKMIEIVKAMHDVGLVDLAPGSYSGPGNKGNRTTRIRASVTLRKLFREAKFSRDNIRRVEGEEIIILRADDPDRPNTKRPIEYVDNVATKRMRDELYAYNELIASSFIDVPSLDEPKLLQGTGHDASTVHIHADNARTRRIFSRDNWRLGGRFYGGWWQRIGNEWRSRIMIDFKPAVEVDFKGLHIAMLYQEAGSLLEGDPYELDERFDKEFPTTELRGLVKRLALTAINAKDRGSAFKAFREGCPAGSFGKHMTDKQCELLLSGFLERNPLLEKYLCSDQGIRLMYSDSQITARIHKHFTDQGVPVLSIHDSYIIDCWKAAELRDVMAEASAAVMGKPIATSLNLPGKDELNFVTTGDLWAHIEDMHSSVKLGYIQRMHEYDRRTGRALCPAEISDRL